MSFEDELTYNFLLNEGQKGPEVEAYIQALEEILEAFRLPSQSGMRRIEVACNHVRAIRRLVRQMRQRIDTLESESEVT